MSKLKCNTITTFISPDYLDVGPWPDGSIFRNQVGTVLYACGGDKAVRSGRGGNAGAFENPSCAISARSSMRMQVHDRLVRWRNTGNAEVHGKNHEKGGIEHNIYAHRNRHHMILNCINTGSVIESISSRRYGKYIIMRKGGITCPRLLKE